MKKTSLVICILLCCQRSISQRLDLDLFGGLSNYQGDLQPIFFTLQNANPAAAVILKYGISEKFYARAGFSFGSIAGYDSKNKDELKSRNLNFRSGLKEFHAGLEYRFLDPETFALTPYVFAGIGIYTFNPYTYYETDTSKTKVFLQPLGTEGQGLPEYPDRKMYALTQFCIPYGIGVKWQINCNLNVGAEFRQTKTFTDYLDDVSTTYADQNALLKGRGQMAVDLAWRKDDYNGSPYPVAGTKRGNPNEKDWFYFVGITVGLKINDCETGGFSLGGLFHGKGSLPKARIDCPKVW